MNPAVIKIGKRGTVVIPLILRKRFDFHEGDLVIGEDHGDGILIRPAIALPIEKYSAQRQAEFLLSNAVDAKDYAAAEKEVHKLGLDPKHIAHYNPIKKKK